MCKQARGGINCVIFDLDGTLLNTLSDLHKSVNHALLSAGLPARSEEEVKSFVGNGIRMLIERAVPPFTPCEIIEKVYSAFQAHYAEHCYDATQPYPGIIPLLEALREEGIKTAILSNKAQFAVSQLHERFFAVTISLALGESAEVKRKPDPSGLLRAMHLLGESPATTLYVGDSEVDIATCRNAGLRCISVSWGFRSETFLLENGATHIIAQPHELSGLL